MVRLSQKSALFSDSRSIEVFDLTRFYTATFLTALNNLYMALGVCGNDQDYSEAEVRAKCREAVSGIEKELESSGLAQLAAQAKRLDSNIDHYLAIQIMPLILTLRDNIIHELTGNLFCVYLPKQSPFIFFPSLEKQALLRSLKPIATWRRRVVV